jgi:hypothetical protein
MINPAGWVILIHVHPRMVEEGLTICIPRNEAVVVVLQEPYRILPLDYGSRIMTLRYHQSVVPLSWPKRLWIP